MSDDGAPAPTAKRMRLRYAGQCRACGVTVPAGETAVYEREVEAIVCIGCSDLPAVTAGAAGASAQREYERRVAKREERVRAAHPKLGGFLLAVTSEPQSTTAWAVGARGEELLGQRLDGLASRGVRVLHDRRIPGSKANIDHIAVGARGVFVVDAKRYTGRPQRRVDGGLLRPRVERLVVGSRDQTRLVEGMHRQVAVVRGALDAAGATAVAVRGVLCFVDASWPLIGGDFVVDGVDVLWPRKLAERLEEPGPLDITAIERVHRSLAGAFPPA